MECLEAQWPAQRDMSPNLQAPVRGGLETVGLLPYQRACWDPEGFSLGPMALGNPCLCNLFWGQETSDWGRAGLTVGILPGTCSVKPVLQQAAATSAPQCLVSWDQMRGSCVPASAWPRGSVAVCEVG